MKIIIETIPHKLQRYSTCGDWYYERVPLPGWDGKPLEGSYSETLHIKISNLVDWRHEALIAVHELVEVLLCRHAGVTQEQVDQFDTEYEKNRKEGNTSEPGDDSNAPYRRQHSVATGIERILAAGLDVDWKKYENELNEL